MKPGVLVVGNYPPPYGGVPNHIADLVPDLVHRDWRVHVLSSGTSGIERHDGFTVYRDSRSLPRRRFDTLTFLLNARRRSNAVVLQEYAQLVPLRSWLSYIGRVALAAKIVDQNDIGVIAGYNLLAGAPVAAMLGELYGLPFVIANFGEIYSDLPRAMRARAMIRRVTEQAARLTCMTRHCAASYELIGLEPAVQIIPYGIDVTRFAPGDASATRESLGLAGDEMVVLFVGRMIADMGLDTVIEAAPAIIERIPAANFVFAGVAGDLTPAAEALAARLPTNVRVLTNVPGGQLPELFRAADLVVVPTKGARACGSLAAGEASATGKAVVGSRVGGVPEYVVHGVTGLLVDPDDPAALASAVGELLADSERLRQMGCAGLEYVRRKFNVTVTNARMDVVLREVVNGRGPNDSAHSAGA